MTPEFDAEAVHDTELLARFIFFHSHIRSNDTVRPDAFMPPPPDFCLSVTRHDGLSVDQLWQRAQAVALQRSKALLGRADISATVIRSCESLNVVPAKLPENPQHAHVVGWPSNKPAQKSIAQKIAADATFARLSK